MTTKSSLDEIQREIDTADSLLRNVGAPWDANDLGPFCRLKDAVDAQQRAVVAMFAMLERESRISAAQRGRVSGLEAWVS